MSTFGDDIYRDGDEEAQKLEQVYYDDFGGGYEWDAFVAYKHTETGRLYWTYGSGCSCDGLFDGISSASDLYEGNAKSLASDYKGWAEGEYRSVFSDSTYKFLKGL